MRNPSFVSEATFLSTTAEHALRAMLALAGGQKRPLTAERLAGATGIPANYLAKTLYRLTAVGLLRSTRGPAGGFALAAPADEITVATIADVFARPARSSTCLLGNRECRPNAPCAAHRKWTAMLAAARAPLATTTLADLLGAADTEGRDFIHSTVFAGRTTVRQGVTT